MQPVNEVGGAIAAVYAKALMNLAETDAERSSTLEELTALVELTNREPALERFFVSTVIDVDARRESIERMFRGKADDRMIDFLQVLNRKDRLPLLAEVVRQYRGSLERQRNQIESTVTTATPLGDASRAELLDALKKHTGKSPVLTELVDPEILGGMVVRTEGEKIDFSVAMRLRAFRKVLLARASHEIHGGRNYFDEV